MTEQPFDQTTFFDDSVASGTISAPPTPTAPTNTVPPKKPPVLLFVAAAVLGILILLTLIVVLFSRPTQQGVVQATPTPLPLVEEEYPLQEDIKQLEEFVQAADPDQSNLPFPPVNLNLRLGTAGGQ